MIKILLDSVEKNSHNMERIDYAATSVARSLEKKSMSNPYAFKLIYDASFIKIMYNVVFFP